MKTFRYLRPLEIKNWDLKPTKKGGICFLFDNTECLSFTYCICPSDKFFSKEKAKTECEQNTLFQTPFKNLNMSFSTQILTFIENKVEFEELEQEIKRIELHNTNQRQLLSLEVFKVSTTVEKPF